MINAVVMDKLLYDNLTSYYSTLSAVGYKKDSIVHKLLVILFIQELLDSEYITDKDRKLMNDLIYQFVGSTCEISLPDLKCCCGTKLQ